MSRSHLRKQFQATAKSSKPSLRRSSLRKCSKPLLEPLEDRFLPSVTVPILNPNAVQEMVGAGPREVLLPAGGKGGNGGQSPSIQAGLPEAADAERSLTEPTAWWWYHGVDINFLSSFITRNNARIIDLKVESTAPERFSAVLVQNTGAYAKSWWWYVNDSAADLAAQLPGRRLIDLETYQVGGQQRFAAVMVPNTGAQSKAWWYYYNASPDFIAARLQENNARIIDLDSYVIGGQRYYETVMVANQGVDGESWWWYYNVTPAFVSSKLQENHARLLDLAVQDNGQFSVVMVPNGGIHWWWYYGQSDPSLNALVDQNGARLIDIETYNVGGQQTFAAIMVNNSNDLTTRVGDILRGASDSATSGLYLKQVGGPVLAALNESLQFEPASMIKVVIHLYAMRQIQAGTAHLSDPITYYFDPNNPNNKDVNPDSYAHTSNNAVTTTLEDALRRMMQNSDNRTTQAVENHFGKANINALAASIGMSSTVLTSTLGSGIPGNFLTLADAGRLYEGVANGTLLTPANRDEFYTLMIHGTWGALDNVVLEEASKQLNLPKADPAVQNLYSYFVQQVTAAQKGGSYTLSAGTNWREIRTNGALVGLPFRDSSYNLAPHSYFDGAFIENALAPKANPDPVRQSINNAMGTAEVELLREPIDAALATWRAAASTSLTATPLSASQISLSWAKANGAVDYKIERSSNGTSNWVQIDSVGGSTSTYSNTGLVGGTRYYYRVRTTSLGGDSSYSPVANATTYVAAPSSLSATAVSTSQLNIAWSAVNGPLGYKVERSPDNNTWSQIATTGPGVTSYADSGLPASTHFYYRVRGYNGTGDGAYSSVANATTYVAAPSSLSATAVSTSQIDVAWSAVNAPLGYKVERSPDNSIWSQITTTGPGVATYADSGLTASTHLYYRVRAYNATGDGAYSPVASDTTLAVVGYSMTAVPLTLGAGQTFSFVLTALDAFNHVALGYRGTVSFSSTDGAATLASKFTFSAADNGVHVFTGVTLRTAGGQIITATDTATSTINGTSILIAVTPAAASVVIVSGFATPIIAGTPATLTVTVEDPYGNVATGYTGTVTFSSSDSQAIVPGDYTFVSGDNGTHTFTSVLLSAGTQSITGTDPGNASLTGTQAGIAVTPAAANHFQVDVPSNVVPGAAFDVTVTALDPYGNIDTNYLGTITFTSSDSDPGVILPPDYSFQPGDAGVATFFAGTTLITAGDQKLTITDTVSAITGSATITVVPPPGPGSAAPPNRHFPSTEAARSLNLAERFLSMLVSSGQAAIPTTSAPLATWETVASCKAQATDSFSGTRGLTDVSLSVAKAREITLDSVVRLREGSILGDVMLIDAAFSALSAGSPRN